MTHLQGVLADSFDIAKCQPQQLVYEVALIVCSFWSSYVSQNTPLMGEVWAFASELMKFLMVVPVSQTYINLNFSPERTFAQRHLIARQVNDVAIFIHSSPKVSGK